jgi:hypothetical protein
MDQRNGEPARGGEDHQIGSGKLGVVDQAAWGKPFRTGAAPGLTVGGCPGVAGVDRSYEQVMNAPWDCRKP